MNASSLRSAPQSLSVHLIFIGVLLLSQSCVCQPVKSTVGSTPPSQVDIVQTELIKEQNLRLQALQLTVDNLTSALKAQEVHNSQIKPSEIVSWTLVAVGWAVTIFGLLFTAWFQSKMKVQENILKSIAMFDGGTQKRSVGLAMLEALCKGPFYSHEEHPKIWAPVMVTQAQHLLLKSERGDADYEVQNLDRVVDLLTSVSGQGFFSASAVQAALAQNQTAISAAAPNKPTRGVAVSARATQSISQLT